MKKLDKELVLEWYYRGREDLANSRVFAAPDHAYLRTAYANGYADEIMGVDPCEQEVLILVMG